MEGRISFISLFLISQLLVAFGFFQWDMDWGNFLFGDRPSVPLIVLSFGPAIQVVVLLMVLRFLRVTAPKDRFFPRLILKKFDADDLTYSWEKTSAWVILGVPLMGFGYFWLRFFSHRLGAWDSSTLEKVDLLKLVPVWLVNGGWDMYRYGSLQAHEGSSFLPFWQPVVIMGGGSLAVIVLTALILRRIRSRADIRRRATIRW